MIKKYLLILTAFLFLSSYNHCLAAFLINTNGEEKAEQSFFSTISKINKLKNELAKSEIDLKFLQENFENEADSKIVLKLNEKKFLEEELIQVSNEIDNFFKKKEKDPQFLQKLKDKRKTLKDRITAKDLELDFLQEEQLTNEEKQREEIDQKEKELRDLNSEIKKNIEIAWKQFWQFANRIAFFVGIILVVLLFRKIAQRIVKKYGVNLPKKRQEILIKITNNVVYTIVALAIFAALFAQFATFLPFLALLGTGLAFAIRDVISSFLAWFFIGTKDGFKLGDLIEIDAARGRVLDIRLVHTLLQETGQRGPTGNVLTIPNKKIFEGKVINFSKMFRFTWMVFDFLLEKNSNLKETKKILKAIIEKNTLQDLEEIKKNLPSLSRKFGFNEENIAPQIFTELEEKGIRVKVKFLCRLPQRHILRSKVCEEFLEIIQHEKGINLRFLSI